jgi:hypothetical protein
VYDVGTAGLTVITMHIWIYSTTPDAFWLRNTRGKHSFVVNPLYKQCNKNRRKTVVCIHQVNVHVHLSINDFSNAFIWFDRAVQVVFTAEQWYVCAKKENVHTNIMRIFGDNQLFATRPSQLSHLKLWTILASALTKSARVVCIPTSAGCLSYFRALCTAFLS